MSETTPPPAASGAPTGGPNNDHWMRERAEELSAQAKERAAQAREKAGPAAAQAKERATELAGKAAPSVGKGVEALSGRLNKLTKGRFRDQIGSVTSKAHGALDRAAEKNPDITPGGTDETPLPPQAPTGL